MDKQEGVYYHIYNRGTDKRAIFNNDRDYLRFIDGLERFRIDRRGEKLVDVISYCLMSNHYHLLVRSMASDGVAKFMGRFATGYTMYFNKKYDRKGVLFESGYKYRRIESAAYLLQTSRYIHLNPLSLTEPGWKTEGVRDAALAFDSLRRYPWTSLDVYLDEGADNDLVD